MKANDYYIIKDGIMIMDKDTGVEMMSTKWSNGMH